jgi:hypothetical protein
MTPLLILSLLAGPGDFPHPGHAPPMMLTQGSWYRLGHKTEPEVYVPQAGDILVFRNSSICTRAAYYLTLSGSTTHVCLVVPRPDGTLSLLEATPGDPVVMGDLCSRIHGYRGRVGVRRRKVPLTAEQSARLTEFACAQVGKPFHLLGVVLPTVSFPFRIISGPVDLHRLHRPKWICTSLVLRTCLAAGLICPDRIKPEGAVASDLVGDVFLDLSCGWYPAVPFVDPCK